MLSAMQGTHQVGQPMGRVHVVEMPRPEKGNALDPDTVDFLHHELTRAESSPTTVGFVLTATGKAFCAGADVDACTAMMGDVDDLLDFFTFARTLTLRLATTRLVTVAAVNGLAAAGGLELAASCDIIVASDSARFADRHARYGFVPSFGATAHLPRKIGRAQAAWLMLADGTFDAHRALVAGLVSHVVPTSAFSEELSSFIERLAGLDPAALASMKSLIADQAGLEAALSAEARAVESHARAGLYAGRPTDF